MICDVGHISGSAVDVLDTLARLQLTARRCGGQIRLRHAEPSLVMFLELIGLGAALPVDDEQATAPGGNPDGNPGLPPPPGGRRVQPEQ